MNFQTKMNHSGYQKPPQTGPPSVKPQINKSGKTGSLFERDEVRGGKYCKKPSHVLENYFSLQRKEERENKSNMMIVSAPSENTNCEGLDSEYLNQSLSELSSKVTDNCYKPFITRGKVAGTCALQQVLAHVRTCASTQNTCTLGFLLFNKHIVFQMEAHSVCPENT